MPSLNAPRIVLWAGSRRLGAALIALVALAALASPAGAAAPSIRPAATPGNVVCTENASSSFDLTASAKRIQTPDGNSVYTWAYGKTGGSFQLPGPVLCVHEGDVVTVNLTNKLSEPTSIVFPGQSNVTSDDPTPGLLAGEASAGGGTVQYTFTAERPGTYLYESGTEPSKQIEMGLYGAIIVRPALGDGYAYNDASTAFDPEREYILVLHDIDPDLHQRVERGQSFDITTKHDRYWTINGRSFPDTVADNAVSWLPHQPYGSLVWVEPYDPVSNPLPALIRYVNAGLSNHPFHPHGNHLRVVGRDGALLKEGASDGSMDAFTKTIGSGQSYDLLFSYDDPEDYSLGNPVQFQGTDVVFPGLLNTVNKDDLTFYSGSPYLGEQEDLLPAVTSLNECGEFYFPWHSHALNEFQNFNEGFGGLATLLRVDPPSGCPDPAQAPLNTAAPQISGTPTEGQTLTATDGTWTGTPPLSFSRQWQRLSGSVWVNIAGAIGSTYTLTGADVGTQVRISVTAENDVGSATAVSEPTAVILSTLRLTFSSAGTVGGVGFENEDIVSFDGTSFAMLFDGSDPGALGPLTGALVDVDAFAFLDADSIIMSFDTVLNLGLAVPGVAGVVTDADIVRFDASSLGATTAGTFSIFFDANDVGLTPALLTGDTEDVDAIQQLASGNLVLSTKGAPTVPGVTGAADEDLLTFTPTALGATTAGSYALRFDGSDVGLAANDLDSAWTAGNGDIYLSTTDAFAAPGLSAADEDVFVFTPSSLGLTTAGSFSPTLQFDGSGFGQGGNDVDGAGRQPGGVSAAAALRVAVSAQASGNRVTFRAQTKRCAPCKATLRLKARGSWRTLKMKRVRANAYAVAARNLPRGSVTYYAVIRDLDTRRRAVSAKRTVRIGPAARVSAGTVFAAATKLVQPSVQAKAAAAAAPRSGLRTNAAGAPARVGAAALVTFNLCADEGTTTLPGAGSVPFWGFSMSVGGVCDPAQLPGPALQVETGDTVTVNLTNNLSEPVSLVIPGQTLTADPGEVAASGSGTYEFTAAGPGPYLYESGANPSRQHAMGLSGALVVRPLGSPPQAYADPATAYDVERVLVLSELDVQFNNGVAGLGPAVAPGDYDPEYWLINGRPYDPANPAASAIPAAAGQKLLLRFLNAGQEHHTMTLLGRRQRVIARDSFQPFITPEIMAETIATGSTADSIVDLSGAVAGQAFPLYSRQLALTNGASFPGGMLAFITVGP